MYGIVLMMALSGGSNAPDWNAESKTYVSKYGQHQHESNRGRRGGGGCCGCYGGGGRGGYYGGGCYGGGYGGGCYGGGYGGGYGGCYGGGWGGCYGGGRGYGGWAGMGYGGSYGSYYGGSSPYYTSGTMMQNSPYAYSNGYGGGEASEPLTFNASGEAPARIIVHLPENAKLTIGDSDTQQTSSTRVFMSPLLKQGDTYYYTLKAQMNRNDRVITKTKKVKVQAGKETDVTIDMSGSDSDQSTANR